MLLKIRNISKRTKRIVSIENNLSEVEITVTKKSRNLPSINAITEIMGKLGKPICGFDFTFYEETVKVINNLKSRKVSRK